MKRVLAAFWFILLTMSTAFAVDSPHTSNMSCSGTMGCHTITLVDGVYQATLVDAYGVNNLCLKCHNPQAMVRGFTPKDIANPFGSTDTGLMPSEQFQSSHNWAAPVNMPAAGAQISVNPVIQGLRSTKAGVIGCTSCHNHHSFTGDLLLRQPGDTLCLDCHRQRNQRDVQTGTHPVNFTYTSASKVKLNPGKYLETPINANPANPTSAMWLPGGKLVCTTCHSPHYADSNARTFDNASSSTFGLLSSSRGRLLRTDMRGGSANEVNICTNCHAGKLAHNGKGQNIQCADCHAAHVDPLDGTLPNVWLVRRYMNPETSNVKVLNQYTGAGSNWAGAFGVCVACHTVPAPGGNYPPEHASSDANVCRGCHTHNGTLGSFSAGCGSCHGSPPQVNAAGGPSGYAQNASNDYAASGVFKDESLTPHVPHTSRGYTCSTCHAGNQHATGDFQQVFRAPAGPATYYGATPSYNGAGPGTCLNTYCHSNGAPDGLAPVYQSPAWALGKNSIVGTAGECSACHDAAPATNAHTGHLSYGYSCTVCHAATAATNSTIKDAAKHVNGVKDVAFSGAALGTEIDASVTCSTSYCHSNGRGIYSAPSWTVNSTGACGTCHATAPGLGSPLIASGAHFTHFSTSAAAYGPMFSQQNSSGCQACHNFSSTNHVNQSIDVNGSLGYASNGTGTCTPCHTTQVNWKTGAVACESCHTGTLSVINGVPAPNKSQSATLGHGAPAIAKGCTDCHERNARHINGGTRLQAQLTGGLNTECKYCHDNSAKVTTPSFRNMSTHFLTKGGSQAMACAQCHDPHGSTNLHMVRTVVNGKEIVFRDMEKDLVNTTTNQGLCQVCHTQTAHFRAGIPESAHPTTGCLSCHQHRAAGGAFKPMGTCDACHGYPPAPKTMATAVRFGVMGNWSSARYEDYSGGGGAHLVAGHVSPNAKPSEGWRNCAICHNSGATGASPYHKMALPLKDHIENVRVDVDPRLRFSEGFIVYTGSQRVSAPAQNATGSCFNVRCHFKESPRWSIER